MFFKLSFTEFNKLTLSLILFTYLRGIYAQVGPRLGWKGQNMEESGWDKWFLFFPPLSLVFVGGVGEREKVAPCFFLNFFLSYYYY